LTKIRGMEIIGNSLHRDDKFETAPSPFVASICLLVFMQKGPHEREGR
jgi:hypothetical protein